MKIVVLDKSRFLADFPPLSVPCEWKEYAHTDADEVVAHLMDADIAVTSHVRISAAHLAQLPSLRMITTNSTGYDTIDAAACERLGITLCNLQDWCTNSVVEHILAFLFALKRNVYGYTQAVRNGEWSKQSDDCFALLFTPQHEIAGSTIGIFGYGVLGRLLEKRAQALGMYSLIAERKNAKHVRKGYTAFDQVLEQSDVVVVLYPLNGDTYQCIGARELSLMSEQTILINCGRGGVVEEEALLHALENHMIAGAALDVMESEPPESSHPLLHYKGHNLLISSHVAFASRESVAGNTRQVMANIERFCAGLPQNVVTHNH